MNRGSAAPGFRSTPTSLIQALQSLQPDEAASIGWGVIVAVTSPTVSVQIRAQSGQVDGVACLGSYASAAQVGDMVALVEWPTETGEDRLVLGGINPLTMIALYSGASSITIKNNGSEIEIGGSLQVDGTVTAQGLVLNGIPQFDGGTSSASTLQGYFYAYVSGSLVSIPYYT